MDYQQKFLLLATEFNFIYASVRSSKFILSIKCIDSTEQGSLCFSICERTVLLRSDEIFWILQIRGEKVVVRVLFLGWCAVCHFSRALYREAVYLSPSTLLTSN
jgi:hypothetical protein